MNSEILDEVCDEIVRFCEVHFFGPSLRQVAEKIGRSHTTVMNAFKELEEQGRVEATRVKGRLISRSIRPKKETA